MEALNALFVTSPAVGHVGVPKLSTSDAYDLVSACCE